MPQINAQLCYASCCDDPHRCGLVSHCSFGHAGWQGVFAELLPCKPGISMAAVALANGLNANMLRKWVNEARLATASLPPVSMPANKPLPMPPAGFVALRLPEPAPRADLLPNILLEVQRADLTIKVTWPGALASECSAWLREWLR